MNLEGFWGCLWPTKFDFHKLNKCDSVAMDWINAHCANTAAKIPAGVHSNRRNNLHVFTCTAECWLSNALLELFSIVCLHWKMFLLFLVYHRGEKTKTWLPEGVQPQEKCWITASTSLWLYIEVHGFRVIAHLCLIWQNLRYEYIFNLDLIFRAFGMRMIDWVHYCPKIWRKLLVPISPLT